MSFVPWSQMVEPMSHELFFFFHLPEPSWTQGGLSNIQHTFDAPGPGITSRACSSREGTWEGCRNLRPFAGTFELSFHTSFCVERKKHQQNLQSWPMITMIVFTPSKLVAAISRAHKIYRGPDAEHHFSAAGAGHWQSRSRAMGFLAFCLHYP